MLSSEEMIMDTSGKMLKLLEFVKANGGEPSNLKFVTELPEASEDCMNQLFVIANIGTPQTVNIFDADGDKTKFITTGKEFNKPWSDYTSINIQGANLTNGNLWDTITVNKPDAGVVVNITAESGSEQLGEYTLTKKGLTRTKNPYSNTAINLITAVTTGINILLAACVSQGNAYVWLDLINGEIIN